MILERSQKSADGSSLGGNDADVCHKTPQQSLVQKQVRRHWSEITHARHERHLIQDVTLHIDPRRDFD
jgi:hypothetical protein